MNLFLTYDKVNAGNCKYDTEQNNCRSRCEGRISAAISVEHIVNVANNSIHFSNVKICAKKCHCVAIRLKRADKSCDHQIENGGRDHRNSDFSGHTTLGCAVNSCRIVVGFGNRANCAGEKENLKRHNNPNCVKTKHKHLRPVRTVDKVDRRHAEQRKKAVYKTVVMQGRLKKYHKHKTYGKSICYVRKEINSLEKLS